MLQVGDLAPDFQGVDCAGRQVSLASLRGRRAVIFFFPRAFSPACTIEARHFRDSHQQIRDLGAELVGISVDDVQTQCEFARQESIDFALLADPDRAISGAYGVVWPMLKVDRRITYILDEQGRVECVIKHEVRVYKHLDDVLAHLQRPRTESKA